MFVFYVAATRSPALCQLQQRLRLETCLHPQQLHLLSVLGCLMLLPSPPALSPVLPRGLGDPAPCLFNYYFIFFTLNGNCHSLSCIPVLATTVAMCLPPGIMKRERQQWGFRNKFLFAWLMRTSSDMLCSLQPAPLPPVQEALLKSQAHCEKQKPRQLVQSSYQRTAANYLIFRSYDDLPGAARPHSPAADAKTTPPPPHSPLTLGKRLPLPDPK